MLWHTNLPSFEKALEAVLPKEAAAARKKNFHSVLSSMGTFCMQYCETRLAMWKIAFDEAMDQEIQWYIHRGTNH